MTAFDIYKAMFDLIAASRALISAWERGEGCAAEVGMLKQEIERIEHG